MGWLSIIGAAFKALAALMGLIERKQDRDTGAALQRGKDSEDELTRITKAVNARLDPAAPPGVRDEFDRDGPDTGGH